jgi:hypothetical protein
MSVAVELSAFAGWWLQELRDSWAAATERIAPQRTKLAVIDLNQDLPTAEPAGARATVLLPESHALACVLRLPPLAQRDVARAVDLQLERELPLARAEVYVDWHVREEHADRSRIIDVVVARRSLVDRALESIRAQGWRPIAVTRTEPDGRQRFNLLPAPSGRLSFEFGKRERYLAWSAGALIALYLAAFVGRAVFERLSVADELAQARTQMARIRDQRALLTDEGKPIALLHEVMVQPSALDGVAAISEAVPKDSWIYQADIRAMTSGVSLHLEAYSPTSTALLQGLETSGRFAAIELVQATSAGQESGTERVELRARTAAGARP